jgi:hypothetical protein
VRKGKAMTLRNTITEQLKGRIFKATFTKADGSTRQAYGQVVVDERLTEDHPTIIAYSDFTVGGIRRMKLEPDTIWTIKSGKTIIKSEAV